MSPQTLFEVWAKISLNLLGRIVILNPLIWEYDIFLKLFIIFIFYFLAMLCSPQQWKGKVLTTGPPGNSLSPNFNHSLICLNYLPNHRSILWLNNNSWYLLSIFCVPGAGQVSMRYSCLSNCLPHCNSTKDDKGAQCKSKNILFY